MHDHGFVPLIPVACSQCGAPTVTTPLCARPDLCYPCFAALVRANYEAATAAGKE